MHSAYLRLFTLALPLLLNACTVFTQPDTQIANAVQLAEKAHLDTQPIQCPALTASDTCDISNADKAEGGLWIFGDILSGDLIYKNGGLQIDADGRIQHVGCLTPPTDAAMLSCPNHVVSPGLINPHDHLSYNQNYPGGQQPGTTPPNPDWALCNNPQAAFSNAACKNYRYDRRNEWRKGLNGKPAVSAPWGGQKQAVAWNELRHVMVGTTTIAGSGGQLGLARNPDVATLMENFKHVDYDTFPLGDTSNVTGHDFGNCDYPDVATPSVLKNRIFLPHVAEGINEYAQNELYCLTGSGSGSVALQAPNSSFIHSVAATPNNANTLKQSDMTVVWSPRSNLSLYGNTAQVAMYDNMGIRLALSSDWTPSGSINLIREMSCAYDYNNRYLNGHFSKQALWQMVTSNAARSLGLSDQLGQIAPSYWADIAIYKTQGKGYTSYYDPMFYSNVGDVALVLRGGTPLYGDSSLMQLLAPDCESMGEVCNSNKSICVKETGYSLSELQTFNKNSYSLYTCSPPSDEPSCTPARYGEYSGLATTTDYDGDGIDNSSDNCPDVFNPIRPMDNGKQADYNGNGIGDACDPNPL